MSPYTQQVVDKLGQQGQQQIQQYLAPAATAAAVGTGQFGSARGAGALGQAINRGMLDTQTLQAQALQQGYGQALQAAQNEAQQRLAAAGQLGNLATTTQALGLGDVNALATLGAQQQAIGQNAQLFPLQQLANDLKTSYRLILDKANGSLADDSSLPMPTVKDYAHVGVTVGSTGKTLALMNSVLS